MQNFLEENRKNIYYIKDTEKNKDNNITEKVEEKYFISEKLKKMLRH